MKRRGAIDPGGRAGACTLAAGLAVAIAGCGGPPRQDVDEPAGIYPVEVTEASFPTKQTLARTSELRITVRNVGRKTIPNINVAATTGGAGGSANNSPGGFNYRDLKIEDPNKPIFVIDKEPMGGQTAYVNTWALGRLRPGQSKTFVWQVTAVKAQPFDLTYRVQAGLDGKARAVAGSGGPVEGRFRGMISAKPPSAKVANSGREILSGGQRLKPRSPERVVPER